VTLLSRCSCWWLPRLVPAITIQMYNEFDLRRARQVEVQNQAPSLAKFAAAAPDRPGNSSGPDGLCSFGCWADDVS
jgi:hypothetical protein